MTDTDTPTTIDVMTESTGVPAEAEDVLLRRVTFHREGASAPWQPIEQMSRLTRAEMDAFLADASSRGVPITYHED